MVAAMLIALLALVGLTVDGGGLYFLQRDSQNAVDNAVLAAAWSVCQDNEPDALERVAQTIHRNGFFNDSHTSMEALATDLMADRQVASTVDGSTLDVSFPAPQTIQVDMTTQKPNYFIRVVNDSDLFVGVSATAICADESSPYADHAVVGTSANCRHGTSVQGTSPGGYVDGVLGNSQHDAGTIISGPPIVVDGGVTMVSPESHDGLTTVNNGDGTSYEYIGGAEINGYNNSPEQFDQINFTSNPQNLELLYDIDWFDVESQAFSDILAMGEEAALQTYGTPEAWRVVSTVNEAWQRNDGSYNKIPGGWYNPAQAEWNTQAFPQKGILYVEGDFGMGGNLTVTEDFTLIVEGQMNLNGSFFSFGEPAIPGIAVVSWYGGNLTPADPSFPTQSPTTEGNCNIGVMFNTSKSQWAGLIYVPFGGAQITMGDATVEGQVIAYRIHIAVGQGRFNYDNQYLEEGQQSIGLTR